MAERFLEVRRERDRSLKSWRALDPLVGYLGERWGSSRSSPLLLTRRLTGSWRTIATICCASAG
jgi:hypothetical protein